MKFHLRIFDKYHHWNEASSYDHGIYDIRRCYNRSPKSQAQDSLVQAEDLFNSLLQKGIPACRQAWQWGVRKLII